MTSTKNIISPKATFLGRLFKTEIYIEKSIVGTFLLPFVTDCRNETEVIQGHLINVTALNKCQLNNSCFQIRCLLLLLLL